LICQSWTESKRLSEAILRNVARDVVARIDPENQAMWGGSLGAMRDGKEMPRRARQKAIPCLMRQW
jgi:hypothetical protein